MTPCCDPGARISPNTIGLVFYHLLALSLGDLGHKSTVSSLSSYREQDIDLAIRTEYFYYQLCDLSELLKFFGVAKLSPVKFLK